MRYLTVDDPPLYFFRWYCRGDINDENRVDRLSKWASMMLLKHGDKEWFFKLLKLFKNYPSTRRIRFGLIESVLDNAGENHSAVIAIHVFLWNQTFFSLTTDYTELLEKLFGKKAVRVGRDFFNKQVA